MPRKSIAAFLRTAFSSRKHRIYFVKSICFVGLALTTLTISQTHSYTFKVSGITDLTAAKELTDPIREVFNKGENPYQYYPVFNDSTNEFDFSAAADISKEELEKTLSRFGKALTSFNKKNQESWTIGSASSNW